MLDRFSQRLTVTLDSGPTPENAEIQVTLTSEMKDCDVDGWFEVFQRLLSSAGFGEREIMKGACHLAFNEYRPVDLMRSVAKEYELTMNEHTPDYEFSGPISSPSPLSTN